LGERRLQYGDLVIQGSHGTGVEGESTRRVEVEPTDLKEKVNHEGRGASRMVGFCVGGDRNHYFNVGWLRRRKDLGEDVACKKT